MTGIITTYYGLKADQHFCGRPPVAALDRREARQ